MRKEEGRGGKKVRGGRNGEGGNEEEFDSVRREGNKGRGKTREGGQGN
jgi:hypothetical protein